MLQMKKNKALWDAKKVIAQIVTNVVNLEDINYTVAEVQTLLDGITVGGHKIQDELITLNQIKAWHFLFDSIENNSFEVSKRFIYQLHALVANEEALVAGQFRNGMVSISGTNYLPPAHLELEALWNKLEAEIKQYLDLAKTSTTNTSKVTKEVITYQGAIILFAKMAKIQFFFDGNKRTARMMMSGLLLMHGYPMINVPAHQKQAFNQTMIDYYDNGTLNPLYQFLISCLDRWVISEFELEKLFSTVIQ